MKFTRRVMAVMSLTVVLLMAAAPLPGNIQAAQEKSNTTADKVAIVVASFGTTVPRAVVAIDNITKRVREAFPHTEVRITFTSNIIRSIWRKRQEEAQKWLDKGVPEEILYVKNIISTIGDLREDGFRTIIVQPTHIFFMEQSHDLNAYVQALGSIRTMKDRWRPFDKIVMGRPALGMPGVTHAYSEDVDAVVNTLAGDAERARKSQAMLVYMGHGNEHWSTGIYGETQKKMRERYPDIDTFIGVVEGYPSLEDILPQIADTGKKKIVLKPFMIVAGDHAVNDMTGEESDSWKSILEKQGYTIEPVLEGLGSNDRFADIFVDHIRDVAKDHGISLR